MTNITFAVVVPTHNRPDDVGAAVYSILTQSEPPEELIVVDDGSDPPFEIPVDLYESSKATRISVIRHPRPLGPARARNLGILTATTDWIAFLDDDDVFFPDKLKVLRNAVRLHPEVDVLHHPALIRMKREKISYVSPSCAPTSGDMYKALLVKNVVGGTPLVAARRQALIVSSGFDHDLKALEDYDLWLRLARDGYRFLFVDEPLTAYSHITKRASVTKTDDAGRATFETIRQKHQDALVRLSQSELSDYQSWVRVTMLQRAALRMDYRSTLREALGLFKWTPSVRNAAIVLVSLFGCRALIRARAILSSQRAA